MADPEAEWSSQEVTLRQAIKEAGFKFPIIVKACGNDGVYEVEDPSQHLPADRLILLEDQVNHCYAEVKVLQLEDENGVAETKGKDYVAEYNQLVGKEVLIPLDFPNKVKIVHKPGKRRRYAVTSEVIENLPRFLRVEADTKSCDPDSGEEKCVSKGDVLEVINVQKTNETTFLKCKLCGRRKEETHLFSCDSPINFTALDDIKEYTLADILSKVLLPKVVKFQDCIYPSDVIMYDDDLANDALLMTFGPLEVTGKRRRFFIVGQLRMKDMQSRTAFFKRIMIPNSLWDKEKVRVFTSNSAKACDAFRREKFNDEGTAGNYVDKFYMLPKEPTSITYLQTFGMVETHLEECSSDESSDYEKPIRSSAPPIPGRGWKSAVPDGTDPPVLEYVPLPIAKNKVSPDIWKKLVEKARSGFGHIHNELLYFFSVKNKTRSPSEDSTEQVTTSPTSLRSLGSTRTTDKETWKPVYAQSVNRKSKPKVPLPDPDIEEEVASGVVPARPPKPPLEVPGPKPPPLDRPLPDIPATVTDIGPASPRYNYDYPVFNDFVRGGSQDEGNNYGKLSVVEIKEVTRKNQTAKDFCKYTVNQVRDCFTRCAMEDLARICWEEKIDGAFLASFDLDQLKEEPFNLNAFSVNKVKLIIQDGWRPSDD